MNLYSVYWVSVYSSPSLYLPCPFFDPTCSLCRVPSTSDVPGPKGFLQWVKYQNDVLVKDQRHYIDSFIIDENILWNISRELSKIY